jgi:hypothetical protein
VQAEVARGPGDFVAELHQAGGDAGDRVNMVGSGKSGVRIPESLARGAG